jgi:hypothetical protein
LIFNGFFYLYFATGVPFRCPISWENRLETAFLPRQVPSRHLLLPFYLPQRFYHQREANLLAHQKSAGSPLQSLMPFGNNGRSKTGTAKGNGRGCRTPCTTPEGRVDMNGLGKPLSRAFIRFFSGNVTKPVIRPFVFPVQKRIWRRNSLRVLNSCTHADSDSQSTNSF